MSSSTTNDATPARWSWRTLVRAFPLAQFLLAQFLLALLGLLVLAVVIGSAWETPDPLQQVPPGRDEVVFWHFWGGQDRDVVERVVDRFNRSQDRYFVRPLAMPGNNLDLKLFLAVNGGSPPDLINQDDPIVADWASRGALTPIDELASEDELRRLRQFLVPAARHLGSYHDRLYAVCNGLDIRALYYNASILREHGLEPPRTLEELDRIAALTTVTDRDGRLQRVGYLPDHRRLWAWGIVFGGSFYDAETGQVTADQPEILAALNWMTSYRERYGAAAVSAFRQDDQSLPGKTFPLLAGRYTLVMDGQWRVRDIAAARQRQREQGQTVTDYGVCPLPPPAGGRSNAGWVNGNFFLVPRGAAQPRGAWEFMKFWSGFDGFEREAARTCAEGGWIPVSPRVARHPVYQQFLEQQPLMKTFVQLAQAEWQVPTPVIPGGPLFQREINAAVETAMKGQDPPPNQVLLEEASQRVRQHLARLHEVPAGVERPGHGVRGARSRGAENPAGESPVPRQTAFLADNGGIQRDGPTGVGATEVGPTARDPMPGSLKASGPTASGPTAGGSTAGGSTASGSTASGSTASGSTAGGSTASGSTGGGPVTAPPGAGNGNRRPRQQ